ncbi:MAG: dihydrofolate reductase family protein [Myxococcales bacterium]|nr:dihydrofolate reductase family protein [Myxococcales bacterium]
MAASSRVRVYLACSMDGFIAGPDDDLSWLNEAGSQVDEATTDPGAVTFEAFMAQIGAMLMGRHTYDVVAGMGAWPYGDVPVLVPTSRPLEPVVPTVRAVQGPIESLVDQAKEAAGEHDVYLDGGALVRSGLDAGLVDEMVLTLVPMLVAGGVSLFDGLQTRRAMSFTRHAQYGPMVQLTLQARSGNL